MGDNKKRESVNEKDAFQKFTDGIRYAPDAIFDFGDDKSSEQLIDKEVEETGFNSFQKNFQGYVDEKPKTVADGVFKGLLSIGAGVFSGITGIVTEPIREVQKKGAIGVVTGVGKGISGLVTKPLAGVIDMGVKTTQGVINTPGTISRSVKMGQDFVEKPEFPIFGVTHDVSLKNAEKHKLIHPTVSLIDHIRKNGMETHGIFRESGNVSIIKQVVDNYNFGKAPNINELEIREITGIVKYYLRNLPEPLLTFDLYDQFLNVLRSGSASDRDAALYKSLIRSLPDNEKLFLQSLLALLYDISQKSDINKMSTSNLAIVFGPSLLRPRAANAASELFDMPDVSKVVDFIIVNHVKLF